MTTSALRRGALVVAGVMALVLGTVGIVVPLLPTTPFLLLAAACFVRSSDRLYNWLIHHPWFGSYIRNYREHRAITLGAKIVSLTLLWSVIGYSAVFVTQTWWLRGVLAVVAIGVSIHVLVLKTLTREMLMTGEKSDAADSAADSAAAQARNKTRPA